MDFKCKVLNGLMVIRTQFPIISCFGVTIHKCQGLTLQCVVTDVGSNIFENGQIYVALSRASSLDGLHLINFNPSKINADVRCITEYNRLRNLFTSLPQIRITHSIHAKVSDRC